MFRDSNARSILSRVGAPVVVLAVVVSLVVLVLLVGRDPSVVAVTPIQASEGAVITVDGAHFGDQPGEIRVAGRPISRSLISSWTDTSIQFVLPEAAVSGLLQVISTRGQSRGVLFRVASDLPLTDGQAAPVPPQIAEISSADVTIGSIVEIRGDSFGTNRWTSRVEAWLKQAGLTVQLALAVIVPLSLLLLRPSDDNASAMAVLMGMGAGIALLRQKVSFSAAGPLWQRGARFLVGVVGLLALYLGLKFVFPGEGEPLYLAARVARYALVGLWAGLGAPWLFLRLRLASRQ